MNKRFKQLVNYPQKLKEEMIPVNNFKTEKIELNSIGKNVFVKVAEDPENDEQHFLYLFMNFDRIGNPKLPELQYFFKTLNKEQNKYTSKSLYSRSESGKFVPKSLTGSGIVTDKINEMFKELIKMDKPIEFVMATYEKLQGSSLERVNKLISVILQNGYVVTDQGINHENRNYWKFSQNDNKSKLTEEELKTIGIRSEEQLENSGNLPGVFEHLAKIKKIK